ncbi:MAG: EAL domain-containing protein [Eubacteriales bacterium]|nr:EAL domain-containing protein [Eubacteriales bacterium]
MNRVIKNEFGISKKVKIILLLGVLVFFSLSVFIYVKLYTDIKKIVRRQAVDSIRNISELNADSVSRSITNRKILLDTIAARIMSKDMWSADAILRDIEGYVGTYDFYNMGVLDENMDVHLTSGDVINVAGRPQFETAWDDEFHLSESYLPVSGGEYAVNLFSYPVCRGKELKYVIIATYYSKNLTERMNISSIRGNAFNFLLSGGGDVVIYPRFYENKEYNGLMKYINYTSKIIPDESGDKYFVYNGEKYYAHFEQLGINQWHLMTCAKEREVFADANMITRSVFMGMGLLWMMIIIAVFMTLYSVYRSRMEMRQAVFYDELLHIENGNFLPVFFKKLPPEEVANMFMMTFDIDKFKEFNYIYGEESGDNLLKYIAQIFREELPTDYLFRHLSDNFVALVHCEDQKEFIEKIEKVLGRFERDIDGGKIQSFDISAGVRKMNVGDSFRRIMSDALIAKGTIKGIQVQQYAFYDENILYKRMSYMEMESDFARALRANEFRVYYQPRFDMCTGKIIGAEALVRWVKADGTIIPPGIFIPCFETSRQIILLDEAMLEAVCRQMNEMEGDGIAIKKVSVNLSRVHLKNHGILPKIEKIVKESGVNPTKLSFEITESALYEDSIPLKHIVDFLHRLGCKVDMDDYGVGVSGPNALAANQFDMIKLDKSFIDGIGDQRTEAVIKSTISLSRTLGMEILAEGVEEKYQVDSLLEWGCGLAQGFYFSPPVPEEEYRRMLVADKRK